MFEVIVYRKIKDTKSSMHSIDTYELKYFTGKTNQTLIITSKARLSSQFEEYVLGLAPKKEEINIIFNETVSDNDIGELVKSFDEISSRNNRKISYKLPKDTTLEQALPISQSSLQNYSHLQ